LKASSIHDIRKELSYRDKQELEQLVLRMARFKKENKELLTYLLFESQNEEAFIASVKRLIDNGFQDINRSNYYYIKKSVRKLLREIRKYCRYSGIKESEVELHLYFCERLKVMRPAIADNKVLLGIYNRELHFIKTKLKGLHPDLQHDYKIELQNLEI
jgi:hypothetical protein